MPIMQSGMGFMLDDLPKGDPVPEGTYHVRLEKAPIKTAKPPTDPVQLAAFQQQEKWPYLELDLVVQAPEEFLGRHFFDVGTLKPGAQFKLRQIMDAAGWDPQATVYTDEDITGGKLSQDLVGIEMLVVVTVEKEKVDKNTGTTYPQRNKVQKYLPVQ